MEGLSQGWSRGVKMPLEKLQMKSVLVTGEIGDGGVQSQHLKDGVEG